ncbi:MAG: hypothetical protein GTO29_04215 [Candidatus Latescibacteria bacterium]|nr:hypothetical protein [Candidatus Latescibacterota bacterium]NIO55282.1 hypothetical protein [Candidatus Latescibacterota bacterium]
MAALPCLLAYIAIAVFVVAVITRFIMWSRLPIHLRWELYPVAHEAGRAHYGGSYLEETDWWKKPRENSMMGELKVMVPEILFLAALKEHNPRMWIRSFPFHFGIYLAIGATFVMILKAVLGAISTGIVTGTFGAFLSGLGIVCGAAGLCLGILGALGLLQRRLTHPDLEPFDVSNVGGSRLQRRSFRLDCGPVMCRR